MRASRASSAVAAPAKRPRQLRLAARESQVGRREPPAVAVARHAPRGSSSLSGRRSSVPLRRDDVAVGRDLRHRLDIERAPARSGDRGADLAGAAAQLARSRRSARARARACRSPARSTVASIERPGGIEQRDQIEMPAPQRRRRRRSCARGRVEMRLDPLHVAAPGGTASCPDSPPPATASCPSNPPATIAEAAVRMRPADVERGDRDRPRRPPGGSRIAPVAAERPEPRPAARGEGETLRRSGRDARRRSVRPSAVIGLCEDEVERRLVDLAVELERQRAIGRLLPAALEMEGAVAPPHAVAGDAELRRGEHADC